MTSAEQPPIVQPDLERQKSERRREAESFVERDDLRHLNGLFGAAYFMAHTDGSEPNNAEVETARARARADDSPEAFEAQTLAFFSLYGEQACYAALMDQARRFRLTEEQREAGLEIELTAEEKEMLEEYKTFIDILINHPDLRPKLLSKMCYVSPEEGEWSERRDFQRFLYEFYGTEKKTVVFESGDRKSEKMELFLSLEGQADFFEACNIRDGWGFSERAFDDIRNEIPALRERMKEYKDEPLVAAVLTPFLPDLKNEQGEIVQSGVLRTFTALRKLMAAGQEISWNNQIYDNLTDENFRLLPGITHEPGLKLELIDFGANRNGRPTDIRDEHSPHAQVLALGASSSGWVREMDGDKIPYAWALGYIVSMPARDPWARVPYVCFDRDDRRVELYAYWYEDDGSDLAVPVLLE